MFEILLKKDAIRALRRMRRFYARQIVGAIDRHLRREPERPIPGGTIKKLRGRQDATYRLRVGDYRVFYDVAERTVSVVTILHKSETPNFYVPGGPP